MYDVSGGDSGREWIEVVNKGTTPIDLSTYKLFEGGVNHKLTVIKGDALIPTGGTAIIADNPEKFLLDWPNTPGTIFDASFSGGLSNSGESLAIRTGDAKDDDKVAYTSGSADGNGLSLSRGGTGSFRATHPTPGVYVDAPVKVVIAPPSKVVTQKPTAGLQRKAATPSVSGTSKKENDSPSVTSKFGADVPENFAKPTSALPAMWVWILGACGLALLGVGALYATKLTAMPKSPKEVAHAAIAEEAATYEIIE